MRITTKVIQNNSLRNINTNKLLQDQLSQQMSTEKKINRPSDDPIIAIRSLRLRTNVNQITQYYERNAPDAESWLQVTESALTSMNDVITDMYDKCVKGSNEDLKLEDRKIILTALEELRNEVYATGNSDYAGRYVFTGYRTDTPLTFTENVEQKYNITEQLDASKIDSITYVETSDILDINKTNFKEADGSPITVEQEVSQNEVYRIRLAYKDLFYDDQAAAGAQGIPNIQIWNPNRQVTDAQGQTVTEPGYDDAVNVINGLTYEVASIYGADNPYAKISEPGNENKIIMVKETGELLLGSNVYSALANIKDNPNTADNEGEIRISYDKEDWKDGDLRPEHYFRCTTKSQDGRDIFYNEDYLLGISDEDKQTISYDVGLNQSIRVNTTADEVFIHDIGRDVEDMLNTMEETIKMEEQVEKLKKMLEENTVPGDTEALEKNLAAAEKALVYLKEKTQKVFERGISKMQGHLDTLNFAVTENGTRGQKLELISNRLMSQKTNFETLKSENEDIDITDVAIKLSSAELTYSSALMATGKVLQNTLLNFI
ncbi:MAG: flagellar hook-associated protein FlgL [Lachnospiraceae bacterium]|nr:flagellar hook-associated protein FlgL [Lachnospiraceae bacterium]